MSTPIPLEDPNWKADALGVLEKVARSGEDFDAYTLQDKHGLRQPPRPNMWGSLFATAHKKGIIAPVGYHQSQRRSRSGGTCRVWRGVPDMTYEKAIA